MLFLDCSPGVNAERADPARPRCCGKPRRRVVRKGRGLAEKRSSEISSPNSPEVISKRPSCSPAAAAWTKVSCSTDFFCVGFVNPKLTNGLETSQVRQEKGPMTRREWVTTNDFANAFKRNSL